jgi:HEAT repeat protein
MTEYTPYQRPTDPRTNDELFHTALAGTDEDVVWSAINELQQRGSREAFEHARELCASPDSHEQRVGVDVLAQLGIPDLTFHEETLAILLGMLEQEREPTVLKSIALALGHRHDPRAIEPLVRLKKHPDEGVREGVVFGLLSHEDELAIQALIELSRDPDAYYIRDWATFGLGTQIKADTLAIREALVARLADEEGIVRGEAMIGLAGRYDQRMLEPLFNDLSTGWLGTTLTDEAGRIRESLYPVLVQMSEVWEGDKASESYKHLEESIERCKHDSI